MPNTPIGLPYPDDTAKFGQAPAQIQALAEAVDAALGGVANTGWVDLAYAAGYSAGTPGQLAYKVVNGVIYFRGGAQKTSGTFTAGTFENVSTDTIPLAYCPGVNTHGNNIGTGSRATICRVDTTGVISFTAVAGVTGVTWASTALLYPIG